MDKEALIREAKELSARIESTVSDLQQVYLQVKQYRRSIKERKEQWENFVTTEVFRAVMSGAITGKNAEERKLSTDNFIALLKGKSGQDYDNLMAVENGIDNYQTQAKNLEIRLSAMKLEQELNIAILRALS